jgi:L-histidine N-alpha-methyltransferase
MVLDWQNKTRKIMDKNFASDLIEGFTSQLKYIPSKYFYDENGSRIFQKIMNMPEYYLTDCEFEIFNNEKKAILQEISNKSEKFNLIEFGAGDGLKTKILLKHFLKENFDFMYIPIDISKEILEHLEEDFLSEMPDLKIETVNDDYFHALHTLRESNGEITNIVMFLGSNIGNYDTPDAIHFLRTVRTELNTGDMLFIGFDLKKNPEIILDAYNDKSGITRDFNLNLLHRINREFDANFDVSSFIHYPLYDPVSGRAKSFLVSLKAQKVTLNKINLEVDFKDSEPIFTEVSQKYDYEMIDNFAINSGFKTLKTYSDSKKYFANVLWEAV